MALELDLNVPHPRSARPETPKMDRWKEQRSEGLVVVLLNSRSAALQCRVAGQIAAAVSQDRQGQAVPQ